MYGRTPYEAVRNFRSSLQRAISCVISSVITVQGVDYHAGGSEHVLILGEVEAAKLPGADVALSVRLFTRVQEHGGRPSQWRVNPTTYFYTLEEPEGREIIAYHWHPDRRSPITFPHLHLEAGAQVGRGELQKAHVPTGYVGLEDVVGLTIREFGVRPRRDDWAQVLDVSQSDPSRGPREPL